MATNYCGDGEKRNEKRHCSPDGAFNLLPSFAPINSVATRHLSRLSGALKSPAIALGMAINRDNQSPLPITSRLFVGRTF
jgi:hypothetical protein